MAMATGKGKEGDWDCGGCRNRNYAFRSLCNRCKQQRILVDTNAPAHSKWLPRIGDWICSGCSNNNYASREKCKKCGQSKEEAAMPAITMPGSTLPADAHYISMLQGLYGSQTAFTSNQAIQPLLPSSSWLFGAESKLGLQIAPSFSSIQNARGEYPFSSNISRLLPTPKGWRSGDWICDCGFHNYSSRSECKKCNMPLPSVVSSVDTSIVPDMFSTLGTKRPASEEFSIGWDSKRLNAGNLTFEQPEGYSYDQCAGRYAKFCDEDFASRPMQMNIPSSSQRRMVPILIGKGANQWRDGDWMCNSCNNHNFASRSICNRCKTQKETAILPVSVS